MPLTDSLDPVRRKFSRSGSAAAWDAMYERDAGRLDEANFRRRRDLAVAEVLALATPASRVLDLGCGSGPVLAELRRRGIDAVGIDCAPDMLAYAAARLRRLGLDDGGLHQGDCRATGFPDASFDVVVCLGVISFVEDYGLILAEIGRLLKPGGTMILSFRNAFRPLASDPAVLVRRLLGMALRRRHPAAAFAIGRFLDHREVLARIDALGFRYVAFHGIGFGPFCIAGRPLFGERRSIALSDGLSRLFARLGIERPLRWLTDVSVWIHRKPTPSSEEQAP